MDNSYEIGVLSIAMPGLGAGTGFNLVYKMVAC